MWCQAHAVSDDSSAEGDSVGEAEGSEGDSTSGASGSEFSNSKNMLLLSSLSVFAVGDWEKMAERTKLKETSPMAKTALGLTLLALGYRSGQIQDANELPKITSSDMIDVTDSVKQIYDYIMRPESALSPYIVTAAFVARLRAELAAHNYFLSQSLLVAISKVKDKPAGLLDSMCEVVSVSDFVREPHQLRPIVELGVFCFYCCEKKNNN